MGENVKRWYVVRAVSGQENKVKGYIETDISRAGLDDYVGQVLVPLEKVFQVRNGKKISKEKPHMPGYVFIEAYLAGEVSHTITTISGVIGFLSDRPGGEPMPLRKAEVNRMLGNVDALEEENENVNIPYFIDEQVKVIDGPFNGFDGTIEEVNAEKRKLKVTVKIFGRKTPLELSYTQVEKIS